MRLVDGEGLRSKFQQQHGQTGGRKWPKIPVDISVKKKILTFTIVASCVQAMGTGPEKISTNATFEREHEQCTQRRQALSLSNRRKTVTLAPSYVWITLLFDHVVLHFEFV